MRADTNGRPDWIPRPVPKPSDNDVAAALLALRNLSDGEVWALCVEREPRLEHLRRSITWLNGNLRGFCAVSVWRATFKPCLCALVGWDRVPRVVPKAERTAEDFLYSERAFDVCQDRVASALPECRHGFDEECVLREAKRDRRWGKRDPVAAHA